MKMRKIMAAGIAATMAVTSLAAVASAEATTLTFNMGNSNAKSTVSDVLTHFFKDNTKIKASDGTFITKEGGIKVAAATDKWDVASAKLIIKGTKVGDTAASTNSYDFKDKQLIFTTEDIVNKSGYINMNVYEEITDAELRVTFEHVSWTEKDFNDHQSICEDNNAKFVSVQYLENGKWGAAASTDANLNTIYTKLNTSVVKDYEWYGATHDKKDIYALLRRTTKNTTIYRNDVRRLSDTGAHSSISDVAGEFDDDQTYDDNGLGTSKNRFAGLASQVADFFNHKTNGTITLKFATVAAADSGWLVGGVPSTQIGIKNVLDANNFALYVNYMSSTGSLEAATSVDKNAGTVTFDISEILADLGGQTKGVVTDLYYGLNQGIKYGSPYKDSWEAVAIAPFKTTDVSGYAVPEGYKVGDIYNGEKVVDVCDWGEGLLVEEVTLAYEDDAADEEDVIDEEPADEDVDVDEEPADEDVTVDEEPADDEDEDVTVDEEPADDEDEDEDTAGDMVDEEPADEDEAEDENPGTGVALAVVPALMAAAAVVVSKKRK